MQIEVGRLVAAIGCSVSDAQHTIAAHGTENYLTYFHPASNRQEGENIYTPDTVAILIPQPDNSRPPAQVNLPLVTLSNHNVIGLDSVRVHLHAAAAVNEAGQVIFDLTPSAVDGTLQLTEMELCFRCSEPPEGAARVNVEMNKLL